MTQETIARPDAASALHATAFADTTYRKVALRFIPFLMHVPAWDAPQAGAAP